MRKKAQVSWRLFLSFLLFVALLASAFWLVSTMPVQASPAAEVTTAVSATSWCATGAFNGWDNVGQPIYDDGTHGDLVANDGIYSLSYTYATTGTQEWKVVECETWNGHPSNGNVWSHTTVADQEVTFVFDSNDHSSDAGAAMLPAQYIVHSRGDDLPTSFTAVGDFNGWTNNDANTLMTAEGNGLYRLELEIATAGSYSGKVVETGTWNAYGANGRSTDASNLSFTTATDNETVVFLLDTNTSRVTVTQHSTGSGSYCLAGDFNSWDNASDPLYDDGTNGDLLGGDGIFSVDYEIATAARNTWKIFDCGTWDSTMPENAWVFTASDNQSVKFTYDTNDHSSDAGWPFYPTQNIPNAWDDMPTTFTAVGDWQDTAWNPDDTNTIMTNLGDNTYVYTQAFATAGSFVGKATNDSWNNQMSVNGRSVNGGNISFEVNEDGDVVTFWIDGNTGRMAIVTPPSVLPPIDMNLVKPAVQHAVQDEVFYFALTDRFQDGDPSNNEGGITGAPVDHGYAPNDISYYHGGDLAGLADTDTLDYLEGLGISAIWITPVFENNPTQEDSGATNGTGAAYHGYWILSYEDIDPHLGTDTELQDFITAAHARGIKVYFDFVANHTADVISYVEGSSNYRNKEDYPYQDENGTEFDDRSYVYSDTFPVLSTTVSFPYTPQVAAGDENLKKPAWLNDPIYYHNRGNSTFAGESSEYGDFFGLDDVFTEHPDVLAGFTDIMTQTVAAYDIDGFRIDTVKHVNVEFWEQAIPDVMDYAVNNGKPDFFIFGEVFDGNVETLSHYTTKGNLPSVLDFGLHGTAVNFAVDSGATDNLRDFFNNDDYYTDADSNANQLAVFISNHDGGIERFGGRLRALSGTTESELISRMELAYSLLYFGRGFPVIYYGDEQGFVGTGNDKLSREDMFPSQVSEFNNFNLIGTSSTTADDNFDNAHPLYNSFSSFTDVYTNNLALRRGAQIHRYSTNSAGIYAFSRIERNEKVEYIVALNNSETEQTASFKVFEPNMGFTGLFAEPAISSDANSMVTVTVPALDFVLYKADAALSAPTATPDVTFNAPTEGKEVTGRVEVGVDLSADIFAEVNFAVSINGGAYEYLGTDSNAPYRIFYDVSELEPGTTLTFQAIVNDLNGGYKNNIVTAVVGQEIVAGEEPYAIIHYQRPAGDYGDYTSSDFNDFWGLHLWGDGLADGEGTTWDSPKKFAGFDDFGAFVAIRLSDISKPVNYILHKGNEKDTPNDRSFDPSVTPEIWLIQDDTTNYASRAEATGTTLVHYNRPDATYTDWNLYLWQDDWDNDWNTSHPYDGMDDFGAVYTITTSTYPSLTVTSPLNYIMHNGDAKDPDVNRDYTPAEQYEIWLHSGVVTPSLSLAQANNTAVFHYARCLNDFGDYTSSNANDFWGMHLWLDVDPPDEVLWDAPFKATGEDDFGVIFEVPLAIDPASVGYIFHRGNEKDAPTDQLLNLSSTGYEIWVVNGDIINAEGIRRQITSEPIAYSIKDQICSGTSVGDIDEQQAYWLSENTIGWDPLVEADEVYLHTAQDGGLVLDETGITGGNVYTLTRNGDITGTIAAKFPHLEGQAAWELGAGDLTMVPEMLKGQIAVSAFAGGELVDATGLQIPGVLDDLYAADAYPETLGVVWANNIPTLKLWAPTAKSVTLHIFDDADPATASVTQTMSLDTDSGIWSVSGTADWESKYYLYEVEVYVHSTGQVEHNLVTDPYSFSLAMNSTRSQIVDLNDAALMPANWETLAKPELVNPEDITIYEVHMRDFSVEDPLVPTEAQGTFKAFTYPNSNGMQHLQALADAGLSHLHLLPVFDIATIDEDKTNWEEPDFTGADMSSDSEDQQAAVTAVENTDAFNWGYDPFHYTVPEGSYSTVPTGTQRIVEFREMVQAINNTDLRVVMDVVYNHTNASGQNANSVLDKVVPGYYHRLNDSGQVETSTCCENTATEHDMMEKLMVDSLVVWARDYKVDAFRFDLMGHHMKDNMLAVRAALDALTLENDGVDGQSIYLYGEGWNFGEVADNARGVNATQANMAGTGIGTFSDRLRDAVRGGGPFDSGADLMKQGFANGLFYDPNTLPQPNAENDLLLLSDQIRVGLAGNLADYEFIDRNGNLVTGADVVYGDNQPAGYTADPQEQIVYISKHDNQTLYDINAYAIPTATTTMTDRVRVQQMGLSIVSLSQGVPFYQAGSDMLRSKSMDRDSYNSGDWFNKLDFTYASNNWGVGLPVAGKNQDNWNVMQPFLADAALMPTQADIELSTAMYQEWLAIRASSPLFRLETAEDVQDRVSFENTGPDQIRGLIAMNLSDVVDGGQNLDLNYDRIVVLINANDEAQTISSTTWIEQEFILHPVLATSVDDVVKTTTFDAAKGEFVIPGRTTAVFVVEQEYTLYLPIVANGSSVAAQPAPAAAKVVDSTWAAVFALPLMLVGMVPNWRRNR